MDNCYYEREAAPQGTDADDDPHGYEYFRPTDATTSAWSDQIQHGGPPTGLLARALRRTAGADGAHFTRITTEILGAVGLDVNRVRGYTIRPGRRISMVGADLEVRRPDGSFQLAARATAWRIREHDTSVIAAPLRPALTPTPADLAPIVGVTADSALGVDWGTRGFIGSIESAVVHGSDSALPAVWLRPAIDLVGGEPIDSFDAVMTVVDVANGLGTALAPTEWTWMNTDTTVHFTAVPRGPWLGIDAQMATGSDGFGATFADLYDTTGFVGRSAQTVLLEPR